MAVLMRESPITLIPIGIAFEDFRLAFSLLARTYAKTWGLSCAFTDVEGRIIAGTFACAQECQGETACALSRKRAIEQSALWGEAFLLECPHGSVVWAVPVMLNARIIGGIATAVSDIKVPGSSTAMLSPLDIKRAAADLLALATESNLTNAAFLEAKQEIAQRETDRARAMYGLRDLEYHAITDVYRQEEPALIMAIKHGDRAFARAILNRVLASIYFLGNERPQVLKSFLLELVVMMSRSAVEAGGDPAELLGANYSSFAELAGIETEEELCAWLVSTLERIMDAIKACQSYPISVLLDVALQYMQEHVSENLTRDSVAAVACLSPSHFSRMVKQRFGHSFTELLTQMRVDTACRMLAQTEKSLIQICLDSGFNDQSYFTKVFQKITGSTPGEYRRQHRVTATGESSGQTGDSHAPITLL
ncbi:MAG: Arabinose operon regulatory protein [bacterium ADurb.Bin429]|nr:MAG: Arabinose operon regulatory protein [bacterium ADurb.Bin429]